MNIFISWSGKLSHHVASIFNDWLKCVLPTISTFLSSTDIVAGSRWSDTVAEKLENCEMGLICITSENINSSWINFEAGALSKNIEASLVIPILINVTNEDLKKSPLSQFQTLDLTEEKILKLVSVICKLGNSDIDSKTINSIHKNWFPELNKKLTALDIPDSNLDATDKYDYLLTNFNMLKTQFESKFKNINEILSNITDSEEIKQNQTESQLERLKGFWKSQFGSIYYGLFIDDEFLLPYLYKGAERAHIFNIQIINDTIYGRFSWFDDLMKGYIYFKIIDENKLEGGWIFHDSILIENLVEIESYRDRMSVLVLTRMRERNSNDSWIQEYESEKLYQLYRF